MRIQMRPYRQIISLLAFAVLSAAAYSQNLDPTVEVNRAYEGKLMEVHKPLFRMEVPDSVTRFDLDFDYSVFESPYRGSYEFNPYLLSMKPGGSSDRSRRFYMRAGAGYQLKPVLDLVWSPKMGKGFKMDVYALHRSFVGSYWNMASQEGADGVFTLDRKPKDASDRSWKGYDLMSRAGFDARHDWKKGVFSFTRAGGLGVSFWSGISALFAFALVGGLAALDFDRAFVIFHSIFFPGKDNWMFNPRTDQIIQVMPEEFFMNCAILIVSSIIVLCLTYIIVGIARRDRTGK